MPKSTQRIEVIECPYMNNSLFLTINGKEALFSSRHSAELFVMDELDGVPDYIYVDDYYLMRNRKNEDILYVISNINERTYADRHNMSEASRLLKKSANFVDSQTQKGFKTIIPKLNFKKML